MNYSNPWNRGFKLRSLAIKGLTKGLKVGGKRNSCLKGGGSLANLLIVGGT